MELLPVHQNIVLLPQLRLRLLRPLQVFAPAAHLSRCHLRKETCSLVCYTIYNIKLKENKRWCSLCWGATWPLPSSSGSSSSSPFSLLTPSHQDQFVTMQVNADALMCGELVTIATHCWGPAPPSWLPSWCSASEHDVCSQPQSHAQTPVNQSAHWHEAGHQSTGTITLIVNDISID